MNSYAKEDIKNPPITCVILTKNLTDDSKTNSKIIKPDLNWLKVL